MGWVERVDDLGWSVFAASFVALDAPYDTRCNHNQHDHSLDAALHLSSNEEDYLSVYGTSFDIKKANTHCGTKSCGDDVFEEADIKI